MFRMSINFFFFWSSLDCSQSHRACSAPPSSVPSVLRSYTATTSPWSTPRVRWVSLVYKMVEADAMHVKKCLHWYDMIIPMVLVKEFRWVPNRTTAMLVLHLMLNIWVHECGSACTLQKFTPDQDQSPECTAFRYAHWYTWFRTQLSFIVDKWASVL